MIGLLSFAASMLSPYHRPWDKILENSTAALFAQVPEGLLPTVTISLLIASKQMAKRKVLVRRLDAIESLGCVTVICSDKTGTLTSGEMTAVCVSTGDGIVQMADAQKQEKFAKLFQCGCLNSGGKIEVGPNDWHASGSPTEVACLRASVIGMGGPGPAVDFRTANPLKFEIPFNSENKWMLTLHATPSGGAKIVLKGTPTALGADLGQFPLLLETSMLHSRLFLVCQK